MSQVLEEMCVVTHIQLKEGSENSFADWQAKLHAVIVGFPGFLSMEILSPTDTLKPSWVIVQRFCSAQEADAWRVSSMHTELMDELRSHLAIGPNSFQEVESSAFKEQSHVTEVFVTQVNPTKAKLFQAWMAKIHQIEAKFPGFKGVYVQAPRSGQGSNWITLLQFDTPKNLDHWLASPERQKILLESQSLIDSLDSHRVMSPYAGWFTSVSKWGEGPPVWKQTMMVLLVLFPIVMLELKFLSPLIAGLNFSLATFVGNAISVTLVSWPLMPIAIRFLGWWLTPTAHKRIQVEVAGTLVMIALYCLEIGILWNLL